MVGDDDELSLALVLERAQPFALLVDEVGGHIDGYLRDHPRGAVLAQLLPYEPQHGERHGFDTADAADADAARADDVTRLAERGAQPLPRHLQQPKARQAPDLDAGAVHLDRVPQPVLHLALILGRFHVDEVDDDQTADVADAQLAGDLVGGLEIGVEGGRLDVAAARGARGVDVDGDERLGVVDDGAAARGQLHLVGVG